MSNAHFATEERHQKPLTGMFGPQLEKQHYGRIKGQILPRGHLKTYSERFAQQTGLVVFLYQTGHDSVDALNSESE